jgi:hypothetical protein
VSDAPKQLPEPDDDVPVPRLPRGRGLALSTPAIIRIAMFATLLVAVIVMRRPCADNVAGFVGSFDTPDAGAAKPTAPEIPLDNLVPLPPGSTEDDIRRAMGQGVDAGAPPAPSAMPDSGSAQ